MTDSKIVKIQEVAEVSRGASWKSIDESSKSSEKNVRVYKIPHIQASNKHQSEKDPIFVTVPKNITRYLLNDEDVLMVGSNGNPKRVGNVVLYKKYGTAIFASFLLKLRAKENVIPSFLYYQLAGPIIQNSISEDIAGSTGLKNINTTLMKDLDFWLPGKQEQQKIVSVLSSVDETIEKTQVIIKKISKVRKGILSVLLNSGIDHTKFKETPVGTIPISWSYKKLSEVTEIVNGGTPSRSKNEYWENGDIPWATPTDITKQKSKYINKTASYINNKGLDNSSATLLPLGTVLMTSRATIGERSINTVPMTTNQGFKSFICKKDELLNEFLYYLIEILKGRFKSLSSGSTFLEISKGEIESFLIQIPPVEEQKEICKRIISLETKIQLEQQRIEELFKIKNGLMQQLLTGKVRVPMSENEEVRQ